MRCKTTLCQALSSSTLLCLLASPALGAGEAASDFSAALRVLWGLLVVLGLLLIIYAFARKKLTFLHAPGKGIIKVIEVRHLLPKKSLYLIEVRGQEYLLGSGGERIELIAPIGKKNMTSFDDILDTKEKEMTQ